MDTNQKYKENGDMLSDEEIIELYWNLGTGNYVIYCANNEVILKADS